MRTCSLLWTTLHIHHQKREGNSSRVYYLENLYVNCQVIFGDWIFLHKKKRGKNKTTSNEKQKKGRSSTGRQIRKCSNGVNLPCYNHDQQSWLMSWPHTRVREIVNRVCVCVSVCVFRIFGIFNGHHWKSFGKQWRATIFLFASVKYSKCVIENMRFSGNARIVP